MEIFEDFVADRSHRLLHLAYLLTRDHALAEDLLQTALAKSWTAWSRIEDPEPYVRQVLVNTFSSWWRRRWNGEVSTGDIPEVAVAAPQSDVDDRDFVWRALTRLPKRQRAVLALRYFEDLSETQIASMMSISAGAVRSYVAKGLASLRADPELLSQLPAPLAVPEGMQRIAGVHHRVAAAGRRKVAGAALALGVVIATVAALLGLGLVAKPQQPIAPSPSATACPSFVDGYRTVLYKELTFAELKQPITFVPSTLDWKIWLTCYHDTKDVTTVVVPYINSTRYENESCQYATRFPRAYPMVPGNLSRAGVVPGQPVTITLLLPEQAALTGNDLSVPLTANPLSGRVAIAIGEAVGFDTYQFPSPPSVLAPIVLGTYGMFDGAVAIYGPPVTVRWHARMKITVRSQTPGRFTVKANGIVVRTVTLWDYTAQMKTEIFEAEPGLVGGDVTVTVEPERAHAHWVVAIGPAAQWERPQPASTS